MLQFIPPFFFPPPTSKTHQYLMANCTVNAVTILWDSEDVPVVWFQDTIDFFIMFIHDNTLLRLASFEHFLPVYAVCPYFCSIEYFSLPKSTSMSSSGETCKCGSCSLIILIILGNCSSVDLTMFLRTCCKYLNLLISCFSVFISGMQFHPPSSPPWNGDTKTHTSKIFAFPYRICSVIRLWPLKHWRQPQWTLQLPISISIQISPFATFLGILFFHLWFYLFIFYPPPPSLSLP